MVQNQNWKPDGHVLTFAPLCLNLGQRFSCVIPSSFSAECAARWTIEKARAKRRQARERSQFREHSLSIASRLGSNRRGRSDSAAALAATAATEDVRRLFSPLVEHFLVVSIAALCSCSAAHAGKARFAVSAIVLIATNHFTLK